MPDSRYWIMDSLNEQNMTDLELCADTLCPIVDEEEGGIIGYVLPHVAERVEEKLNFEEALEKAIKALREVKWDY